MILVPQYLEKGWRVGVGIVLFNKEKKIFMGERIDNKGAWQMPQGGVSFSFDDNLLDAAKRELYEETGVKNIEFLKKSKQWYYYYLPNQLSKRLWKGKFIGQKQKWFAFKFLGEDEEVNIRSHNKPEFRNWKWMHPKKISKKIVSFKKDIYFKVLNEFNEL